MRIFFFVVLGVVVLQAQAPPASEIFLASLTASGGTVRVGEFENISNSAGYDNQPHFTRDGSAVLFTSVRNRVVSAPVEGVAPPPAAQTDIFRYDIGSRRVAQVTDTVESEYSPTVTPDGRGISVIRVEADGTQRLWRFTLDGKSPELVLTDIKPVGYHAWIDERRVALFVLGGQGKPATLQVADVQTGRAEIVAADVGRSIQRMPSGGISFVTREPGEGGASRVVIRRFDPTTSGSARVGMLTTAVPGASQPDLAWTPDGVLLMAHDGKLHQWQEGETQWTVAADLAASGVKGASRIAVSPKGDRIAIVAAGR